MSVGEYGEGNKTLLITVGDIHYVGIYVCTVSIIVKTIVTISLIMSPTWEWEKCQKPWMPTLGC